LEEAKAFSPSHVTGFFQIFDSPTDPLLAGSRGAGVSLRHGVETRVRIKSASRLSVNITINGCDTSSARVSHQVIRAFLSKIEATENLRILVEHSVQAPIGAGFGTSGAAALSLALAMNEVLQLGLSKIESAKLAHVAEVECKTGLGTVIAETFGGLEIRTKPGAPGIGELVQIPVPSGYALVSLTYAPLSTEFYLSDRKSREKINQLGGDLVDRLAEEPCLEHFLQLSRQFSEEIGFTDGRIRAVLEKTDNAGFTCSTPIFGESVFTLADQQELEALLQIFRADQNGGRVMRSEIDFEGARVLH
jgi:pantoate kinase